MNSIQNRTYFRVACLLSLLAAMLLPLLGQDRPEPKNPVQLEKSIMVTMRDGTRLAHDMYMAKWVAAKLPSILIRTPYNKNTYRELDSEAYFLAGQGFVVIVQDVRGKHESEGLFVVQVTDGDDSDDTIKWMVSQEWSNGKVGTTGCSYLGETQIFQAKRLNPHHAAMIPRSAGAPARYQAVRNGGAMEFALVSGWMRDTGSTVGLQVPPGTPEVLRQKAIDYFRLEPVLEPINYQKFWRTLPLVDVLDSIKAPPSEWRDFVIHDTSDAEWWKRFDLLTDDFPVDVPALHVNGWYDYGVSETLKTFNLFRKNGKSSTARDNQFVIIAPTTHCQAEVATASTPVGDRAVGDARFPYWEVYAKWMDHWLNGVDNGVTQMPRIQYYVMGRNKWVSADEWPLPGTQYTQYYLHSGGRANSRLGDGWLDTQTPAEEPADSYHYDPDTPVPSVGGALCCSGSPDAEPGAYDQSDVEMRHDVLVYSTPRLKKGVEVTGHMRAILYVSSDRTDTDFTVKLVDVYPDGTAYNVQESILRARYREGFDKQVRMTPGEVYKLDIDLYATSNYFAPGHQIRVEISSSNFPRFDRNLNTGGNNYEETAWKVAKNTIHHSAEYPSHLLLPIQPAAPAPQRAGR